MSNSSDESINNGNPQDLFIFSKKKLNGFRETLISSRGRFKPSFLNTKETTGFDVLVIRVNSKINLLIEEILSVPMVLDLDDR